MIVSRRRNVPSGGRTRRSRVVLRGAACLRRRWPSGSRKAGRRMVEVRPDSVGRQMDDRWRRQHCVPQGPGEGGNEKGRPLAPMAANAHDRADPVGCLHVRDLAVTSNPADQSPSGSSWDCTTRSPHAVADASSAGQKVSIRSSARVRSCASPMIAMVVNIETSRSPTR